MKSFSCEKILIGYNTNPFAQLLISVTIKTSVFQLTFNQWKIFKLGFCLFFSRREQEWERMLIVLD